MTEFDTSVLLELLHRVDSRLESIDARLESLPAAIVSAHGRGGVLSPTDRAALAHLLPAIADALGDASWSSADLVRHGELLDRKLHDDLCRTLGATPNLKSLGKLLARGAGSVVNGLQLQRVAKKREGVVWRVCARI